MKKLLATLCIAVATFIAWSPRSDALTDDALLGYSLEDWEVASAIARSNVDGGVVPRIGDSGGEGSHYVWKGTGPFRLIGTYVVRRGQRSFQLDPVFFAEAMASRNWERVESGPPPALEGGNSGLGSCKGILLEEAGGGLASTCAGECPAFQYCNSGTSGGAEFCGCSAGSNPPTEPSTCHSLIGEDPPGTWAIDCTGTCAEGTCKVLCYRDGPLYRWYCDCADE